MFLIVEAFLVDALFVKADVEASLVEDVMFNLELFHILQISWPGVAGYWD